ncbi:MAG TPA: pseudouridine-5'-phosphate glycosidase, partial [Anaerolineales bacterium]
MPNSLPPFFSLSSEVLHAQSMDLPLVALESTVITHGLPHPENLQLAQEMEEQVRGMGAVPATVAVLEGRVCVGLSPLQLERLADQANEGLAKKISTRDIAPAVAHRQSGGTTVAATMAAAAMAGLRVFATGGIGGV